MSAAKRRRAPEGGIGPTPERWSKRDVEAVTRAIADDAGRPSLPYRRIDTLERMLRQGTINPAMRQAGEDFHALFVRAALEPLRSADLRRVPQMAHVLEESEARAEAKRRVMRALRAVGGIASPGGSCVWHVLGCEWSVKDWALRQGWNNRRVSQEQAAGVLVAALGTLQALFGL